MMDEEVNEVKSRRAAEAIPLSNFIAGASGNFYGFLRHSFPL